MILPIYDRVRQILESARSSAARTVNSAQVAANWLIGREIIEEQQGGLAKANYGTRLLKELSSRLQREYGGGYSVDNLELCRRFYREYPFLISDTPHKNFSTLPISDALRRKFPIEMESIILCGTKKESWKPGKLHPNLSWTHYRALLRIEKPQARTFYEIESVKNNWPGRGLERQISSLLYERLALSRDKKGLLKLAAKGLEIRKASDVFKDPVVIEFLGLPESPKLAESALEQALKTGKLTHQDLGQLQLYVNYYDQERRTKGDNPSLGLILCADKNDAVVKYTLGREGRKKIFASRYKFNLPTETELKAELKRELIYIQQGQKMDEGLNEPH